jgi:hypothetical protein
MQLAGLTSTTLFATLCGGLPFATSLGAFIVGATAGFGKDTILLHFTIKFFKGNLKRVARIYFYFAHEDYQRDLRSFERPALCVW